MSKIISKTPFIWKHNNVDGTSIYVPSYKICTKTWFGKKYKKVFAYNFQGLWWSEYIINDPHKSYWRSTNLRDELEEQEVKPP